jgi:hypothetical protein
MYLEDNLDQACYEGHHLVLVAALGIPGLVLFSLGWPLASALYLWWNRKKLGKSWFRACAAPLFEGYRTPVYFW